VRKARLGAEGAFVVAVNSSWGTDFGQPADAPLWCALYDSLGTYGVLSCAATANNNTNVDTMGDLPTACPSDYLISVTNTNSSDVKVNSAGYGVVTIDLGAPGNQIYSVLPEIKFIWRTTMLMAMLLAHHFQAHV